MANEFKNYELNDEGKAKLEEISLLYTGLLAKQEALIPAGRDRALITTKLQEAHQVFARALGTLKAYRKEDE
jgi:hypothetical protein